LAERDKQFANYLKVRERLVNNKAFSEQVKNMNSIVAKRASQADSTLLATEEKTSTTTIYPTEEKSRSFFGKIFGKKKSEGDKSIKIVSEEKVKRDTIALSAEDTMAKTLEQSIQVIANEQRKNNASFLNREAILANANNVLITQMLDVLRKVENEVLNQIEISGGQAKKVVTTGITTICVIMLVVVVLTGLLLYLILTDITRSGRYRNELERAKDEAEYHGKAKQRFLSNMSHEIRTPLQSIIGYADIIRHDERPQHKHIEAISRSSEHLLQIVNEILDYNRITSGKFTFSNTSFDIRKLMDEVVSGMRPQAELKSLNLTTDFDFKGIGYVNGDPFRLKQILYNLLSNAIKFTQSGEVGLSSFYKRKNDDLHFTFKVKDTGIGLSEAECEQIFNEFEQGSAIQNDEASHKGTGLGLTIIKSLIESQGGRIYVKSKLGTGSVFTVYLTLTAAADQEGRNIQISRPKLPSGRVWIVDDDQLILDLCGIILRKNKIDYKSFNAPSVLLNEQWDDAVKYILMDIRMPEMDGIKLCQVLRERIKDPVKIFAITAQVLPDEREFLLKNGFDGLVMKPFRELELLSALSAGAVEEQSAYPAGDIDLTALRKMTYGDEDQLNKVLLRFKEDCNSDDAEIKKALKESDMDAIRLIIHRLAGRIAQIGSKDLSAAFRVCEIELRQSVTLTDKLKQDILLLLTKLGQLCYSIS
jgi:signal transduction histidine kinase/DNA-binding response OmpR family regulator